MRLEAAGRARSYTQLHDVGLELQVVGLVGRAVPLSVL